jgi:hypothetical protein
MQGGEKKDLTAERRHGETKSWNLKVMDLADKIFIVGHPKVGTKQDKMETAVRN